MPLINECSVCDEMYEIPHNITNNIIFFRCVECFIRSYNINNGTKIGEMKIKLDEIDKFLLNEI
jgi:hypothetical protein